ncbi:hypothetical protein B0H10DRAFT_2003051, partial [Mycena sp. CBHHK59/15]
MSTETKDFALDHLLSMNTTEHALPFPCEATGQEPETLGFIGSAGRLHPMDDATQPESAPLTWKDGLLEDFEIFWRDLQPWLQQSGYMLRPRFRPGWVPSWKTSGKPVLLSEDAWNPHRQHII